MVKFPPWLGLAPSAPVKAKVTLAAVPISTAGPFQRIRRWGGPWRMPSTSTNP